MTVDGTSSKIDREKGIIYDVIVLGPTSPNTHGIENVEKGTKYPTTTREKAIPIYEGLHVRIDHVKRPGPDDKDFDPNDKGCDDQYGILREVRDNGQYMLANLHFLTTHPLTPRVLESVDRKLNLYSLSHNAYSVGRIEDGWFVVEEIVEAWSVDLVNKGATTGTLVAERHKRKGDAMKTMKLKSFLRETVMPKLAAVQQKQLKLTLEEDVLPTDAEVSYDDASAADPMEMLAAAFDEAIIAVVRSDGTKEEKLAKIGDLFDHQDAVITGTATEEADDDEEDDEDDDEEEEGKTSERSRGKPAKKPSRLDRIESKLSELLDGRKVGGRDKQPKSKGELIAQTCERFDFTPTRQQRAILESQDRRSIPSVIASMATGSKVRGATGGGTDDQTPAEEERYANGVTVERDKVVKFKTLRGQDLGRALVNGR